MRNGWVGLVVGVVAIFVAACTTPPAAAVKPAPTVSTRPAAPDFTATPPPAEGSATPSTMPSPIVYPRLPIPVGTLRCHTAQLEVAFVGVGAAAGNVEGTFELRNKSAAPCWVYGFVGFQTLDRNGRPIPRTLVWTTDSFFGRSDPASRILLAANTAGFGSEPRTGHAFFNVAGNDVLCDSNQPPVVSLEIWPPDERQALMVLARSLDGVGFVFCGGIELNPLQVRPQPGFG